MRSILCFTLFLGFSFKILSTPSANQTQNPERKLDIVQSFLGVGSESEEEEMSQYDNPLQMNKSFIKSMQNYSNEVIAMKERIKRAKEGLQKSLDVTLSNIEIKK